jgi:hypothetical protein
VGKEAIAWKIQAVWSDVMLMSGLGAGGGVVIVYGGDDECRAGKS